MFYYSQPAADEAATIPFSQSQVQQHHQHLDSVPRAFGMEGGQAAAAHSVFAHHSQADVHYSQPCVLSQLASQNPADDGEDDECPTDDAAGTYSEFALTNSGEASEQHPSNLQRHPSAAGGAGFGVAHSQPSQGNPFGVMHDPHSLPTTPLLGFQQPHVDGTTASHFGGFTANGGVLESHSTNVLGGAKFDETATTSQPFSPLAAAATANTASAANTTGFARTTSASAPWATQSKPRAGSYVRPAEHHHTHTTTTTHHSQHDSFDAQVVDETENDNVPEEEEEEVRLSQPQVYHPPHSLQHLHHQVASQPPQHQHWVPLNHHQQPQQLQCPQQQRLQLRSPDERSSLGTSPFHNVTCGSSTSLWVDDDEDDDDDCFIKSSTTYSPTNSMDDLGDGSGYSPPSWVDRTEAPLLLDDSLTSGKPCVEVPENIPFDVYHLDLDAAAAAASTAAPPPSPPQQGAAVSSQGGAAVHHEEAAKGVHACIHPAHTASVMSPTSAAVMAEGDSSGNTSSTSFPTDTSPCSFSGGGKPIHLDPTILAGAPPQPGRRLSKPALMPLHLLRAPSTAIGRRSSQQDAYTLLDLCAPGVNEPTIFAAVYDGHGGENVSSYASQAVHEHLCTNALFATDLPGALVSSIRHTDASLKLCDGPRSQHAGSTAIVVCIRGRDVVLGNLGDCRAVFSVGGQAVVISNDHKANTPSEVARIQQCGGAVECSRVGDLAVSRALGDFHLKATDVNDYQRSAVTNVPEITCCTWTDECDFLLLASDGLWDVLSPQHAVDYVSEAMCKFLAQEEKERMALEKQQLEMSQPPQTPFLAMMPQTATKIPTFSDAAASPLRGSQSQSSFSLSFPPPGGLAGSSTLGESSLGATIGDFSNLAPATPRDHLKQALEALVQHAVHDLNSADNTTVVGLAVQSSV